MLAALPGLAQVALATDIQVIDAKARASLTPTATTAAIYVSVKNTGSTDDRLLSLSTPIAASAMIHETTLVNDIMKMRMIEGGLVIPAGATLEMGTGGTHVMLMGLTAPLKQGDTVVLDLVFAKAGKIEVNALVGGAAE